MTPEQASWFAGTFDQLADNIEHAVIGKRHVVRLALTTLLTEGHLLLEDVPGTGKTSLAKSIANTVQGSQSRIQFTPDLLPSDVTGVTIYDQQSAKFDFHPGPVFSTIVLADEINRASPKTQSALLEVMEEGHVTVDGVRHDVGEPFMVIATQNPIEQSGTYRLPEAQLDRFLMKTSLGYPDTDSTIALLADSSVRNRSANVEPLILASAVSEMAALADEVHVDLSILAYITEIAEATRPPMRGNRSSSPHAAELKLGVSVRGCLGYVRAAKTWAASQGRNYVLPDDVKDLAHPVLSHRLSLTPEAEFAGRLVDEVIDEILVTIPAPEDRVL